VETLDVDFSPPPAYANLRGNQAQWLDQLDADLATHNRILCVAPGGLGKTEIMAAFAERFALRGLRTLVLATRERLVEQTAERIARRTGLQVDIEMGSQSASPYAPVVVGCVPSVGKLNRLTGFADDHFALVIPDEAHLSLSPVFLRVMNYFHYGATSLEENWQPPPDGSYTPRARVCGFTATPELGGNRSLAEYYQPV
jgi:superfamily II DNA or RNA helicase